MSQSQAPDSSLQLLITLSRANQWVSAHVQQDIRKYGLNPTEFGVLELLYHKGEQPLQQIGEKILMTSGNITYVIDKLSGKGLARRKACPTDRRVIFAEITEQGSQLLEQIFPQHTEAVQKAVSGLTEEEQKQAIHLLKKLGIAAQASFT
ncbi:MarR family winged helix-turn-helix transcriptional regulator [Paenibacillus nasutitermitis]|uniref:HTH-type transcriptional regulator MhqR n=1 Tax=Paenibacillus nasutitermitis TaxID=1652958 RepID=A0A917DZ08_9BACL|nr:MarR family transcriptional regulator [Paenibacillus nasutitermitis]GGD80508.1 HTH-type transcriptional regulator MhqR [Paenibacillus nasutitermitis]